ncbi:hypothetical protein PoB_004585800 [Plakobranchus ocellatus]|uniref:Uncharacterized protein n=1 Tax=Plakobranchus ocellatus TaxID=259542 RepID=A0AAV4BJL5_9GAST|nr:hypothetical protein PoB_004585800 [Plakobranchus ocellatus]
MSAQHTGHALTRKDPWLRIRQEPGRQHTNGRNSNRLSNTRISNIRISNITISNISKAGRLPGINYIGSRERRLATRVGNNRHQSSVRPLYIGTNLKNYSNEMTSIKYWTISSYDRRYTRKTMQHDWVANR